MDTNQLLLDYAGLAVALAGFSGLVVAVRTSASGSWHPRDIWSLSWMLGASMGALFMALLPLVLQALGAREGAWLVSHVAMAIYLVLWAAIMTVQDRRLAAGGYPPRVRYFPTLVFLLFVVCGLLSLLAAVGLIPRQGVFVLGLTVSLLASALALVVFLVILAREAAQPQPHAMPTNGDRIGQD